MKVFISLFCLYTAPSFCRPFQPVASQWDYRSLTTQAMVWTPSVEFQHSVCLNGPCATSGGFPGPWLPIMARWCCLCYKALLGPSLYKWWWHGDCHHHVNSGKWALQSTLLFSFRPLLSSAKHIRVHTVILINLFIGCAGSSLLYCADFL